MVTPARSSPVAVSVVVPARDADAWLDGQLDALLGQHLEEPFEVVVVDNASTDGTRELVRRRAAVDPRVRLVTADERTGAPYCRNVGIGAARADSIVMCDADDLVSPGWLAAMARALRDNEFVTGPLEVDRLNPAWLAGSRGRAIASGPGDFDGVFPFAHSCNLGLRRAVVERWGGFDERLDAGEDIELSFRLWRAGVALTYVEGGVVHYRYRQGLRELWAQSVAYGRARAVVDERVRAAGTELPRRSHARTWLWLARHLTLWSSRPGRARWLWVAGGRVGAAGRLVDLVRTPVGP